MSRILTVNITDILYCSGVESARIEFKAGWDEKTTGLQVLKTICAFANDYQNLNGGYIVIGVAEQDGCAILPPKGLRPEELNLAQRWIRGRCKAMDPEYQPSLSPEVVDGKHLLVVWAPASDIRPHNCPSENKGETRKYFVRLGSETVEAQKVVLQELLQMTARVPFDDRRAQHAATEDMRELKVREFLRDIRSGLSDEQDTRELYRKLRIAAPVNGHDVPKNIGLLLFSDNPEQWFPGARIEIVHFAAGASGNIIEERVFRGGIHEQLKSALTWLENLSGKHLQKQSDSFRVKGWVSYPIPALREALVNAVYHRSYESSPEPVKVYLYPDRIEVISYPGPVPGIRQEHLAQKAPMPPVPARNRRVGEFLKELRLAEGRGTGLPKLYRVMHENGSPEPRFDFDDDRTYFRVTLPAHPEYVALSALSDAAYLRATGNDADALRRIEDAWRQQPGSPALAGELIRLHGAKGRLSEAEKVYAAFKASANETFIAPVTNVLIELLLDANRDEAAREMLAQLPRHLVGNEALEAAILARRLKLEESAHRYFEKAGTALVHDSRALLEFAQTKIRLAQKRYKAAGLNRLDHQANQQLLHEARELLERLLQMDADRVRHAWAWRELARVRQWLAWPVQDIREAYNHAIELLPDEPKFRTELSKWEEKNARKTQQ